MVPSIRLFIISLITNKHFQNLIFDIWGFTGRIWVFTPEVWVLGLNAVNRHVGEICVFIRSAAERLLPPSSRAHTSTQQLICKSAEDQTTMKIYGNKHWTHCDVRTAVTGLFQEGALLLLIWTSSTLLHYIYFIQQMFVSFADVILENEKLSKSWRHFLRSVSQK